MKKNPTAMHNPTVINATPHDINIVDEDGKIVMTFPASGVIARCNANRHTVGDITFTDKWGLKIPLNEIVFGELEGLPEEKPLTYYIVSALAGKAGREAGRKDLLLVDDAVRNEAGQIIGCRALAWP